MRKWMTFLVATLLLVAACTSGDDDTSTSEAPSDGATTTAAASDDASTTVAPSDGATTTAAPGGDTSTTAAPSDGEFVDQTLEGPAPGVTEDTIRIGITYIDLGTVDSVSLNHGDYELAYQVMIDDLNERGGINGRLIEPVFAPISLAEGGNADAVCVELTEDVETFLVMGFFLDDAPACYLELHEKAVIGGRMTPDLLARANAPWFSNEGSDAQADAIAAMAEAGELEGTIGVLASAATEPLLNDTILPALEAAGITPAEVGINDAPTDDQAAADAQAAAILERFESAGVDTILAAGDDGVGAAQALETSSYRPRLVSTTFGALNAFIADEGRDLTVLDGSVAAGPYGPDAAIYSEPDMVRCVELAQAAGIEWVHPDDWTEGSRVWVSITTACGNIALLEAIAGYAGPNLNYATFEEAGFTIGEVKFPGNPTPYFFGPPPSADGDVPTFLYDFDPEAGEYVIRP